MTSVSPYLKLPLRSEAEIRTKRDVRIDRARKHIAKFENMPDVDFIRAAICHARYLDTQSREIAREALKRFDRLTSRYGVSP